MTQAQPDSIPADDLGRIGFKAVNGIFDKWQLSQEQRLAILRLPKSTYYKYLKNPDSIRLDRDQLDRLSYVLNMHAALRIVFNNQDNVYGFVHMPNENPYFNGRTPLSIIESGDMAALYEVSRRVDALRGAGW